MDPIASPQAPPKEAIGPDRLELLAKIASWYFEEDLTQTEIAARTNYSPSMVSRLLSEARKCGVVEIRVHHPIERRVDLEQELQNRLGLEMVRVVVRGSLDHHQMLRRLGSVAARSVEDLAHDNVTIGVAWGPAVYQTVNDLRPGLWTNVQVVQLIGSLGTSEPEIDGQELARRVAHAFGGRYMALPAPLFVDSEMTRQALLNDVAIRRAVDQFHSTELALLGVGTLDPGRCSLLRYGYLSMSQLEDLRGAGAVGDVCGVYVDIEGKPVDMPLTKRMFGIDAATLTAIPHKIGVAGGESKILPIIGASRAGFINVLVTDEVAATGILREFRQVRHLERANVEPG
jgi:deoxyribonucleoside regulator